MALLAMRELQLGDRDAFVSAVEEFRQSDPGWTFAFHFDPEGDLEAYVARLSGWTRGLDLPGRFVPNTFLVGVVGEKMVARGEPLLDRDQVAFTLAELHQALLEPAGA